jgi:hypothetical protein
MTKQTSLDQRKEQVLAYLAREGMGLSPKTIKMAMKGRGEITDKAIEALVAEGKLIRRERNAISYAPPHNTPAKESK